MHHFHLALPLALAATTLPAQGTWNPVLSGAVPPGYSASMAFDDGRGVSVLAVYGGSNDELQFWERAGADWALRGSSTAIYNTRQNRHRGIAYDSLRDVVVVFGGGHESGTDQTVEWNGTLAQLQTPPLAPPYRTRHGFAYDAARDVCVAFGGAHVTSGSGSTIYQDTWTWDGTSWIARAPLSFPSLRCGHAMCYDSQRGRVVMFGGSTEFLKTTNYVWPVVHYADTWEWDGTTWLERTPASGPSPSARHEHAMAYDPVAGVTYLFGGLDAQGNPLGDLWAWDGDAWTELAPFGSPARRWDCGLAFDTARGKLVLFGGHNATADLIRRESSLPYLRDTWEYTPGTLGSYTAFGTGCAGSRGIPVLRARDGAPTAGQAFVVQVDNLPLTGSVFVFFGGSDASYGGLPLPAPLDAIGMPGCSLLVSGDAVFQLPNLLGTALWTVGIPAAAAGSVFYQQAFVFDPLANPLGLVTSAGARMDVGG